ncbi:MAG: hypothetical protein IIY21_11035 [Clostridiales bacterium]|nr:hypothetical protein [Clostridiales bacterium]
MNQRRNNPAEMTIYEQLEKIKEEVCTRYCRYALRNRNGHMSNKLLDDTCTRCPLNKL